MLDRILYKKCRKCGTPRIIRQFYEWKDNGTIVFRQDRTTQAVFLNASLYDDLVSIISDKLGIPVWHLVFESTRNIGRISLENIFSDQGTLHRLMRFGIPRKLMIQFFHELSMAMGFCYSVTTEMIYKNMAIAYVKNPFNLHCIAATIVAAFEAMDSCPYSYSWDRKDRNEYLINVTPSTAAPEVSKRLVADQEVAVEGGPDLKRCPSCGTPMRVPELFEWHRSEGLLINRKAQDRYCIFSRMLFQPVFRELAQELGDEVYQFLVSAQCDWTISHLGRLGVTGNGKVGNQIEAERAFLEYLNDFRMMGYGNPVSFEIGEDACSVKIENPFFCELIAGMLLGLYKGLTNKAAEVHWEKIDPGIVTYQIKTVSRKLPEAPVPHMLHSR